MWVVGVLNFIFVAFALMLHWLVFVLFPTLVEQGWVRVIQNLFGVRSDLAQNIDVLLGATVCLLIWIQRLSWARRLLNLLLLLLLLLLFLGLILLQLFLSLFLSDELCIERRHKGLLIYFLCGLEGLTPPSKGFWYVLWCVVGVEECCHCIEQILVLV